MIFINFPIQHCVRYPTRLDIHCLEFTVDGRCQYQHICESIVRLEQPKPTLKQSGFASAIDASVELYRALEKNAPKDKWG